jgi:hypothetical protein
MQACQLVTPSIKVLQVCQEMVTFLSHHENSGSMRAARTVSYAILHANSKSKSHNEVEFSWYNLQPFPVEEHICLFDWSQGKSLMAIEKQREEDARIKEQLQRGQALHCVVDVRQPACTEDLKADERPAGGAIQDRAGTEQGSESGRNICPQMDLDIV